VALTTKGKDNNYFYHKLEEIDLYNGHDKNINSSWVILSQVKVMDKKRFEEKIGVIHCKEFNILKQKITTLLL